jgi:bromodomain-containing protein 7/9
LPKIRFQVAGPPSGGGGSEGHHHEEVKQKKKRKMSLKESIAIREKIKSVIADIERRDTNMIFKYPVTEEIAPGYFSIVKVPMDTSTMSGKLENNEYTAWEVFWDDCLLMFRNAMAYNPDESLFFKVAEKLLRHTARVVREASNGVVDVRDVLQGSRGGGNGDHHHHSRGAPTSSLGSFQVSNKPHHIHHRRNESIGSEFYSSLPMDHPTDQTAANNTQQVITIESVLSLQGQPSGSKNVIKNALQRRHSFKPPLSNRMMGTLSEQSNGQGMPFVDGTSHLRMKTVGIEAYMQSLRTFCSRLPKQAQSYILRNAAERINPGIIARMEQQKQQQQQHQPTKSQ